MAAGFLFLLLRRDDLGRTFDGGADFTDAGQQRVRIVTGHAQLAGLKHQSAVVHTVQTADLVLHFSSAVRAAEVLQCIHALLAVLVESMRFGMVFVMLLMMMLVPAAAGIIVMVVLVPTVTGIIVVMMLVPTVAGIIVVMMLMPTVAGVTVMVMLVPAVAGIIVVVMVLLSAITSNRVGMLYIIFSIFCMRVGA